MSLVTKNDCVPPICAFFSASFLKRICNSLSNLCLHNFFLEQMWLCVVCLFLLFYYLSERISLSKDSVIKIIRRLILLTDLVKTNTFQYLIRREIKSFKNKYYVHLQITKNNLLWVHKIKYDHIGLCTMFTQATVL